MTKNLPFSKIKLRKHFLSLRKNYTIDSSPMIAIKIKNNFLNFLNRVRIPTYIACYYSKFEEISTKDLIEDLEIYPKILLPKIIPQNKILIFKKYLGISYLTAGPFDLLEPIDSCPTLIPDIVIAPCLAVDKQGHRLGYGGGYYDATIKDLRNKKNILYIGFSSNAQIIDQLPHEDHDQKLDYLITENEIIDFSKT